MMNRSEVQVVDPIRGIRRWRKWKEKRRGKVRERKESGGE